MGQITIYLDDEAEKRAKTFAENSGIPVSRWISQLIRERTEDQWPQEVLELVGAWKDFPDAKKIRDSHGEDAERETL